MFGYILIAHSIVEELGDRAQVKLGPKRYDSTPINETLHVIGTLSELVEGEA